MGDSYQPPDSDKSYGTVSGLISGSYVYMGDYGEDFDAMFLFPGIVANSGDSVTSAVLNIKASNSLTSVSVKLKVLLCDVDDAVMPANAAAYLALSFTSGTAWVINSSWVNNTWYQSADFAPDVEAVIGRPGWSSGNSLLVVVQDDGSDAGKYRRGYGEAYNSLYGAELVLTVVGGVSGKKVYRVTPSKIYGISVANIAKIFGG